MTFTGPKGQGATEYLVLLAVVLIIAMVVVALLGFFPGISYDTKKSESATYWTGVRPFQIITSSQAPNGNLSLVFQNVDSKQLQITKVAIAGGGCAGNTSTTTYLSGGEQKTLTSNFTTCDCASGAVFEYQINISYSDAGLAQSQFGAKTLLGKCT